MKIRYSVNNKTEKPCFALAEDQSLQCLKKQQQYLLMARQKYLCLFLLLLGNRRDVPDYNPRLAK